MSNKNLPSIWDLEVSSVSLSRLYKNEFQCDKLRFKQIIKWLVKSCRFNKKFRKSFIRELSSPELKLTDLCRLFEVSHQHKKSLGNNITIPELNKNELDVYVDTSLDAYPEQQVDLPFFSSSLGRIRDQYEEIFTEDGCRAVAVGECRDEIFENVFQRRIECSKEVMIVDQYGFDGSSGDQRGLSWFVKMIHKSNPELSNLNLVGAYNKSNVRGYTEAELTTYKQDLYEKMNRLVDQFKWGDNMRKHLAVVDPDVDIHQTHIFIDRIYRYTWDYRFRFFSHKRTGSVQKILFNCSFGNPDTPDLKWYNKFRSKTKLLQAV